jgi:hypothetical protein
LIDCAFAQDAAEDTRKWATLTTTLTKPERLTLIACLSDLVDRSKAEGMSDAEFKSTLPKACPHEFEKYQKAILERTPPPGIEGSKREEVVAWAVRIMIVPIYNEFSEVVPYRYRLRDLANRIDPTPEDIASKSAREKYSECLSKAAVDAKTTGMSTDDFKKSLDTACATEADSVHQAALSVWDTYARPPRNRDAAGKLAIKLARMNAVRQYDTGLK